MCGIGGFSLARGSRINPRKLSNALLTGLEARGSQASGFAWQAKKQSGFYKQDIAGSRLSLRNMPANTHTAILHTRLATHGSIKDNANNHPVMSPDQKIALVHNGVIYNHSRLRSELPYKLPEVDTSVIPAILQKYGYERFDMLDGDASIAWLDQSVSGRLNVGRFSHSPLWVAQVTDGSFIFASTEAILTTALKRVRLKADFITATPESVLYTVINGSITETLALPKSSPEYQEKQSAKTYSSYRSMTSGFAGYSDGIDDYADYNNYSDGEFEEFLWSYIEIDGYFYTYSGELLGDKNYMYEVFEDNRYRRHWESVDYNSPAEDYRMSFEDWEYKN
jgi:glucosamine 6-phosphate synthetase-like amidotransferase/phosphosugar isomerase protein